MRRIALAALLLSVSVAIAQNAPHDGVGPAAPVGPKDTPLSMALATLRDDLASEEISIHGCKEELPNNKVYQDGLAAVAKAQAAVKHAQNREDRAVASQAADAAQARFDKVVEALIAADPNVKPSHLRVINDIARVRRLRTTDLLDSLGDDLSKNAVAGGWKFKRNSIQVSGFDADGQAVIEFPVELPEQYEIAMDVRRIGGNATGPDIMVPVGTLHLVCEFDSPRHYADSGNTTNMGQITLSNRPAIGADAARKLLIRQTIDGTDYKVLAELDGQPMLMWTNNTSDPITYPTELKPWMPTDGRRIRVSVNRARIEILSATMRPVDALDNELVSDAVIGG